MSLAHALPVDRRAGRPLLAADVGGTHVRLGLVRAGTEPGQPLDVLAYRAHACADYPGLGEAIEAFLSELGEHRIETGVVAAAGYQLEDGRLISANLPWPVDLGRLRTGLGLRDLRLVNDFQALAHAAPWFEASQLLQLCGPEHGGTGGPVLALGPGTGFGCAVWIPAPAGAVVLATEAGQAALAAATELEIAVLRELLRTRSHVAVEHLLSGPGLLNLYLALCALQGDAPVHADPRAITDAAQSGGDARAREALSAFCALLGSTAADLALACGAKGGVYLAGGIVPGIAPFLAQSRFAERFLGKGLMRDALEHIPVRVVEHGRLGVLGAAAWYLAQAGDS